MKVKEVIKKINGATVGVPVYLEELFGEKTREAKSMDFSGYYFEEQDKTVASIDVNPYRMIIFYK